MCGIVGVLNLTDHPPAEEGTLFQMLEMIRHRGPDGFGIYRDSNVSLGNARLSIIDLSGGDQPISNEDGTLWIVFNGEIFNYVELRLLLEARGHCFATNTDTEVILHLYEDYGPECLRYLNGQFAIALWDTHRHNLFLARDRLGVRPLFYTINDGRLVFGSEIKAILAHPGIHAEIDLIALNQVFTFWSPLTPRSIFKNINEIPPGHYMVVCHNQIQTKAYWALDFSEEHTTRKPEDYISELESLLIDATRIRLRADVPVGAYLSGGLDSSTIAAIIRKYTNTLLDTFSIAFADNPEFDESKFQLQMAKYLGTNHQVVQCTHAEIGRAFPQVIWHTETPILRTAPVPMFLLSQLVHDNHFKVVLTGEGADEFLAGYDIFKEMQVRRFWAKQPSSEVRPLLFRRLYPDIAGLGDNTLAYVKAFFGKGLNGTDSPYYSHAIRWNNTLRTRRFLSQPMEMPFEQISIPTTFGRWSHLAQAQYLEITIFLSQYLLSSQGDRPAMAHAVEGRFPFLDYRVVEFCNRLPANFKLHGMTEKWLLKQLGRKLVPPQIWQRPKRPYRAPIHRSFFQTGTLEYVHDLLSERALQLNGLFNVAAVRQLVRKASSGMRLSEIEDMAVAGILSTQLVHQQFIQDFQLPAIREPNRCKVVDRVPSGG